MAAPRRNEKEDAVLDTGAESDEDVFHDARFPEEEEAKLLKESHEIKAEANGLFTSACYDQAISTYDRALATCPNYLDYDVAVLRCNIAACYLKLADWKSAVDSATASLDRLEKLVPSSPLNDKAPAESEHAKPTTNDTQGPEAVVEILDDDAEETEEQQLKRLKEQDELRTNVQRIRAKALMRRAKAKSQMGGWANLQGAAEDYQLLNAMTLPPDETRIVRRALAELPERIKEAREKEMGEMMSKMKDLGNGFLKPFGLSTDNFKFVQDPKTGGYSMNFQSS
ncbi:hypothetical protein N7468_003696 [Penicillium chermesinum]|uniref:Tetratricopeptide repeat protein 1 n=1 Tax=Penicillium chermesinum TaxID=63820 RepID=A0A9W9TS15_9EURO|nr:uncharacterized protein N7468_003696 [Penicillium chermesinum]KAJ5239077.1 hypothetical protein N7468_003696 [Penicillium chermesinum]